MFTFNNVSELIKRTLQDLTCAIPLRWVSSICSPPRRFTIRWNPYCPSIVSVRSIAAGDGPDTYDYSGAVDSGHLELHALVAKTAAPVALVGVADAGAALEDVVAVIAEELVGPGLAQ